MNILVGLLLCLFAGWVYVERDTPAALVIFLMGLFILYLS